MNKNVLLPLLIFIAIIGIVIFINSRTHVLPFSKRTDLLHRTDYSHPIPEPQDYTPGASGSHTHE